MFKKQLLIILFIFWAQESSCIMNEYFDIVKKVWKFTAHLDDLKAVENTTTIIKNYMTKDNNFKEIVEKLKVINHNPNDITLLIEQLPAELDIQFKNREASRFLRHTHILWKHLTSYVEDAVNDEMFNDLVNEIERNIRLQLVEFRNILIPSSRSVNSSHNGLFMLFVEKAEGRRDILCGQGKTLHHEILSLFQIAMLTEIKAYTLQYVAYSIKYSQYRGMKA